MSQGSPGGVVPDEVEPPAVEAVGVGKMFHGRVTLDDVTVTVPRGEILALIGPSGAGKSTFLRCINHLETIDTGRLAVYGDLIGYEDRGSHLVEVSPKVLAASRSRIGMVFQHFNLFANKTALQNVAMCPRIVLGRGRDEAEGRAEELLDRVGLAHRRDAYPHSLSGGERQRVAIARALAMDPRLLLFDEPTSALDPELVGEVLRVIEDIASELRTMVIVTHEITFARRIADRIGVMADGQLIEIGPAAQVLDESGNPRTRDFLSHVL